MSKGKAGALQTIPWEVVAGSQVKGVGHMESVDELVAKHDKAIDQVENWLDIARATAYVLHQRLKELEDAANTPHLPGDAGQ